MRTLAGIGALLVAASAAGDLARGDGDLAQQKMEFSVETLRSLETSMEELPEVILPGGVTLAHALACVEMCRRLAAGERGEN
jgi:hypothetical protein